MAEHKYTQTQVKRRKEVERDGETYIRFLGVLRYSEPNPDFTEKPEGEDTRTAKQKRKTVWKEVTKTLEVKKVTKGRNQESKNENNINLALETWRNEMEQAEGATEEPTKSVYEVIRDYVESREALSRAAKWNPDAKLTGGERVIQPSTARDYRQTAKRLERDFSSVALNDLSISFVKSWEQKQLLSGTSLPVVRKCHVLMKSALDDAVTSGLIKVNPISALKAPSLGNSSNNKGGTRADMQFVTAKIRESEPSTAIVAGALALHAGLRCGEIAGLRWGDIDMNLRAMKVQRAIGVGNGGSFIKGTKSKSSERALYIDDVLLDVLQRRREYVLRECEGISINIDETYIVGTAAGDYLNPTTISRRWSALVESWGLKDMRGGKLGLHGLRHCFSTAMRATKTNVDEEKTRMQLMGHSSIAMTEYYGDHSWLMTIPTMTAASAWMEPDEEVTKRATDGAEVIDFTGTDN